MRGIGALHSSEFLLNYARKVLWGGLRVFCRSFGRYISPCTNKEMICNEHA